MKTHILRAGLMAVVCTSAVAFAAPSMAASTAFKANLSATSEVPPNDSKGKGSVTATYDDATKTLTWKGTYSDLSGPATAAHFHGPAAAGKNAGVMVPISPSTSPLDGSATLNEAQAKALMDGDLYVNVHTAANKGGEIRGQLTK
jgi:hypothetical protein